jgi:ribosomal protein S12 methylthiotransferase
VERVVEACDLSDAAFVPDLGPATSMPHDRSERVLATTGASAYLKIAEGCDNPCAFCVIPKIRGAFRSRPIGSLVAEARALAQTGVREVNLIAQDSTSYGSDIGEAGGLPALLASLNQVEELRWIRLLYAYPSKITTRLMDTMAATARVAPYIDVPLQHASRKVLARMRRGGSRDSFMRMLREFRSRVPGISIRTTLIVGHPGETEADLRELLGFIEEARFDHLGVFTYSHEPDTASHDLADDVPREEKAARRGRVMELQQRISGELYATRVGTTQEVLIDSGPEEPGAPWRGRTCWQAPDIDGSVLVKSRRELSVGEVLEVTVTDSGPYDLIARPLPRRTRTSQRADALAG